jgi:hypothetical protein
MQSKTDSFLAEIEAYDIEERYPRSFELYEEYSHKPIADTIRESRENFEKSTSTTKKQLLDEAEREVKNFRIWLEENKNLDATTAHYIAVSIKGLLFGLQVGVKIAKLFDAVLNK